MHKFLSCCINRTLDSDMSGVGFCCSPNVAAHIEVNCEITC